MGLECIHIKNFKCIQDFKIDLKQMNLLLGENGSGKTNVLSAISYFYDNMISQHPSYDIFDKSNVLNDSVEITLTYNMGKILRRSRKNKKENKDTYLNYYNVLENVATNNQIALKLTHNKGGRVTWSHDIEKRKVLYHLFPLYQLDAREVNLLDWEELWNDIGDLIKPSSEENDIIHRELNEVIEKKGLQLKNRLNSLDSMLEGLQVKPINFSVKEFASALAKIYYKGSDFSYMGHRLDDLSNGTNSYNYISILLFVLSIMGRSKMKEPVLLMDEPEISLHYHMIDELSEVLFECIDDITVLSSTHSSRFVKNILVKEKGNCTVYQIYKRKEYSQICLLNLFSIKEKRERHFLTEHHVNAFFAKMIVLVEGETEVELLQNSYLKILFPILKEAEVIKGMSDKVVYRIVDTSTRHYNVPMVALLDMDKILKWDYEKKRMIWQADYQFFANGEKYFYGRKRSDTVYKRKRADTMCKKCHFSYRLPFFATEDNNYFDLIKIIQEYYRNYNIFPVKTTIEGTLVNEDTYEIVVEFLKYRHKWKAIETAFQRLYNKCDKVNLMRLLFQGKSDFLLKEADIVSNNPLIDSVLKDTLKMHIAGKTSWVSEWLKFYFSYRTGIEYENLTEKKFAQWCADSAKRYTIAQWFEEDFSELTYFFNSLSEIYEMGLK